MRLKKIEMTRRGLRMALGKIKRRKLHCLPLISIVVLVNFLNNFLNFCDLNV